MTLHVILPLPPSVNHSLIPIRLGKVLRMAKSQQSRSWAQEAAWRVREARGHDKPLGGSLAVLIRVSVHRNRDIDNIAKPLLDALVKGGAIKDDRYVDKIAVQRHPVRGKETGAHVWVWRLEEPAETTLTIA